MAGPLARAARIERNTWTDNTNGNPWIRDHDIPEIESPREIQDANFVRTRNRRHGTLPSSDEVAVENETKIRIVTPDASILIRDG